MTEKEKAIKVIKVIRFQEDEANKQAIFCKEHNFLLEESKFRAIETKLRQVCRILQDEFDTGYVSANN